VQEALPLQQLICAQLENHDGRRGTSPRPTDGGVEVDFAGAPEDAEQALLRLADLAEQAGEPALAERTLRRVVEERPHHPAAVERLAALVQVRSPREALGLLAPRPLTLLTPQPAAFERTRALHQTAGGTLRIAPL
jgi:hypothetical protein